MNAISRLVRIYPRDRHFRIDEVGRRDWHGGDPVKTIVFNAYSVMFSEGEKFFIDSIRAVRKEIDDPVLAEQVKGFLAQESMHTRENIVCNEGLDAQGFRATELTTKIRKLRLFVCERLDSYQQVASTAAMEHFTAVQADLLLSDPSFLEGADEPYVKMWRWHALEEIEHKGVAYDVFQHLARQRKAPFGGYFSRVRAMMLATLNFNTLLIRHICWMMKDRGLSRSPRAWLAMLNFLFGKPGLIRRLAIPWLQWFAPGHHPWQNDNRYKIARLEEEFGIV